MTAQDPYGAESPSVDLSEFPSWIVHEDDALLVLNKPGWLVCHPSKAGPLSSLVGAVRMHTNCDKLHLVARLDREASGLVLIAKRRSVARKYQMAIQERRVEKEYLAILEGNLVDRIEVDQSIAHRPQGLVKIKNQVSRDRTAKSAQTVFEPIKMGSGHTLARIRPETGRKHQIRVHAEWLGHSVVGDKIYGADERYYLEFIEHGWTDQLEQCLAMKRQALHCHRYHFNFPEGRVSFEASMPDDMLHFCREHIGTEFEL